MSCLIFIPNQTKRVTNLEAEVIRIYNEAAVTVHDKQLGNMDIQACHRIGKKVKVICKFVNRKFAIQGLINGKNLKGKSLYAASGGVFINISFCPEFGRLNYLVRKAKSNGTIFRWKVRNGTTSIQLKKDDVFEEISHINDLTRLNLHDPGHVEEGS